MGYAKYHEDDFRIYCERIYFKAISDRDKHKQKIIHHRCPYCNALFDKRDVMFSHIRQIHNITEPLLFVNGTVVNNNDTIYISELRSAYVQMYGFDKQISIDDEVIIKESDDDDIDITDIAENNISTNRFCTIKVGDSSSRIERYSLYSVDQSILNDYVEEWENNIKTGAAFQPFKATSVNDAERLYLEGIYNYFIACQAQSNDKRDRYYEAYSILKKFVPINSLGLCIQKIIAFKFNWIDKLEELCNRYNTKDEFDSVCSFFKSESDIKLPLNHEDTYTIFMEDELQEIYDAIIAFNHKDYDRVNEYLDSHNVLAISDMNLKDKIIFLKVHMLMLEGNKEEAEFWYSEIKTEDFKINMI